MTIDPMRTNAVAEPVWLVFPPLVESNFGAYFPSTAVLAAHLLREGVTCKQRDLNEEFAVFLLQPERLERLANDLGRLPGLDATAPAMVAARWLLRHHELLFDEQGRHDFGQETRFGAVLRALARPFLVNPDLSAILDVASDGLATEIHDEFLDDIDVASELPPEVKLVGLSLPMGPQLVPGLTLARRLKAARPDVRVVIGGSSVSLMSDEDLAAMLVARPEVDAAVRMDGERPLEALVQQALSGDWQPHRVPGVSARVADSVRHRPPGRGLNVNDLAYPRYCRDILGRLADPMLGIVQARGCYWGQCDYCDFVELYDGSPPFRARKPDNFVAELEHQIAEYGITRFTFITESIPPAFARKVCTAILERQIPVRWESFAMVDRRFDRALLSLIAQAGCDYLVIGLETTITRVLKLVHKSADRAENYRFLRDARDVGVRLRVNVIPDLPSTTYVEAQTALADLRDLSDCVFGYAVFPFEATRSSNIGRNPTEFGLVVEEAATDRGQAQYAMNHLRNVDAGMTDAERAEMHQAFGALADDVRRRRMNGRDPSLLTEVPRPGNSVRLAVEAMDIWQTDGAAVCTNVVTYERIVIPAAAAEALSPWFGGDAFSVHDLAQTLGDLAADHIMANLVDCRMLVAAGSDTPTGAPLLESTV